MRKDTMMTMKDRPQGHGHGHGEPHQHQDHDNERLTTRSWSSLQRGGATPPPSSPP